MVKTFESPLNVGTTKEPKRLTGSSQKAKEQVRSGHSKISVDVVSSADRRNLNLLVKVHHSERGKLSIPLEARSVKQAGS